MPPVTDMAEVIATLESLAKAATPGPWTNEEFGGRCTKDHIHSGGKECTYVFRSEGPGTTILGEPMPVGEPWNENKHNAAMIAGQWDYDCGGIRKMEDAAFIAAANPATILKLCAAVREMRAIVDEQALDEGLWFIAEHAPEAYLQQELRRLHAVIEGVTPDDCARAALKARNTRAQEDN